MGSYLSPASMTRYGAVNNVVYIVVRLAPFCLGQEGGLCSGCEARGRFVLSEGTGEFLV